ncbi:vacuole membrane protein KMS1-like [Amaranthus tricolor]|uniref:vacuole membrane protein KMS1-like n=1 Tax=Amaranthus tricolor TaxID=29722 RepID=UPI00258F386E|nr:vacuole membrane protein KMS1-like [Amaranthus tricolor]
MGSKKKFSNSSNSSASSSSSDSKSPISGCKEFQQQLDSLTLTSKPCETFKYFIWAVHDYVKQSVVYLLAKGGWLLVLSILVLFSGVLLATIEGSHEKHVQEVLQYFQFVLWWVALGVASSIGLGSGLHTFVLYLGPHITLFTLKAMQCGRVDLKSAPYDTVQFKRGPSWLHKDCSEFGPPLFESVNGLRVPLSSILPQIQLEAVLWGLGTALGELPPYFISRAARSSGSKLDEIEDLDGSSPEDNGVFGKRVNQVKRWFMSHSQYLNVWTILLLASVPNPLYDVAGIMCGHFGIPFWKFFLATVVGKAIVKTHIQTVFIISVCNNQLLDWLENEFIWVFSHIPGVASVMPKIIAKLHAVKDKYVIAAPPVGSNVKVKNWGLSLASIWNTVVWLVLLNFFFQIVNKTAQNFLKRQLENELALQRSQSPVNATQ